MSKEYDKFWKFHNPENMDVHAVILIRFLEAQLVSANDGIEDLVGENGKLQAVLKDKHTISSEDVEHYKRLDVENLDLKAELKAKDENHTKVICLCGPTRFTNEMLIKQWELTKAGNIVLSWCALPESYYKGSHIGDIEGVKEIVDEVHKRKIDLSDEVLVININGYIGNSTRSEIEYADKIGVPVVYLEQALKGKHE